MVLDFVQELLDKLRQVSGKTKEWRNEMCQLKEFEAWDRWMKAKRCAG